MQQPNNLDDAEFIEKVGVIAQRKKKALQNDKRSIWFGLGMMGIVGWSIVVPTLLGVALGIWLDRKFPETFSWTLTGLVLGLLAGCLIAWHWVNKEHKEINQHNNDE